MWEGQVPKVSIIIPVYNVEKYLKRCLDSVVNQTLKDIEIICINDGSTDISLSILEEFEKKDNRVKVINQKNFGVSICRNTGLNLATGDYISFVDSDDYLDLDFFEKLHNAITETNSDIACSSIIRQNDKKKSVLIKYTEQIVTTNTYDSYNLVKYPQYCFVWNKLYNRQKLIQSGIHFKERMVYEDMIFISDLLEKLPKVVSVPNAYYHYWNNSNSIIKNQSDKTRADKILAKKYLIENCKKHGLKMSKKDKVILKRDFYLFGIKILKEYRYSATRFYYLFGLIPIIKIKEYV